jgi:hypothetical protein
MTVNADERLAELALVLPEIPATPFTPRLRSVAILGDVAYLSGMGTCSGRSSTLSDRSIASNGG